MSGIPLALILFITPAALCQTPAQDPAALARATWRLDEVHNKCSAAEAEGKEIQSVLSQMKLEWESRTAEVQSCQAAEAQASTAFRSEQSKLTELQDGVARLDKALETHLRPDTK